VNWYRIHSLRHGTADVQADNWLTALGIGLGKMGVVQDLGGLACETLPNGHILVRDVKTGAGYAVVAIDEENALPDEPTSESQLLPIPEEALQTSVGVLDYAADVRDAPTADDAIRRAIAALRQVAPSESGAVLRRHSDGWLGFEGAFGPTSDRLAGVVIPPGTGVAGFAVERGIAVSLRDAYEDARFFRQMDTFTGYTTRSLVTLPLTYGGVTYGCAQLINAPGTGGFTREHLADAAILATALATRLASDPIPTPPARG
jgi:hypothetical protein